MNPFNPASMELNDLIDALPEDTLLLVDQLLSKGYTREEVWEAYKLAKPWTRRPGYELFLQAVAAYLWLPRVELPVQRAT